MKRKAVYKKVCKEIEALQNEAVRDKSFTKGYRDGALSTLQSYAIVIMSTKKSWLAETVRSNLVACREDIQWCDPSRSYKRGLLGGERDALVWLKFLLTLKVTK